MTDSDSDMDAATIIDLLENSHLATRPARHPEPLPGDTEFDFSDFSLNGLHFTSAEAAVEFLKRSAKCKGFKLSVRDGVGKPVFRLYCSSGSHSQGKFTTKKVGCQFHICVRRVENQQTKKVAYVIGAARNLEHTCALMTPDKPPLERTIEEVICGLKKVGVPISMICQFVIEEYGHPVNIGDIERVGIPWKPHNSLHQTGELEAYLFDTFEEGARFRVYAMDSDDGPKLRVAAFCQVPVECSNMDRYGDVIMLDGTKLDQCTLRWDTFPVTLLDYNKQIVCGGVFFLGVQTAEVFKWVLETLYDLCGDTWKTLMTDEDSALMSAFPAFCEQGRHRIAHRICAWHKHTNIDKHIQATHCPKERRDAWKKMLDVIFYEENEADVRLTLDKLATEAPELVPYLNRSIVPLLEQFATCFRGATFTLGYLATSPAESANRMIKDRMGSKKLDLTGVRKAITTAFAIKRHAEASQRMPVEMAEMLKPLLGCLGPRILTELVESIRKSLYMEARKGENDSIVRDPYPPSHIPGERLYRVTEDNCSCGNTVFNGLPCSHLICAYRELHGGGFPLFLVNRRWFIEGNAPDARDLKLSWEFLKQEMGHQAGEKVNHNNDCELEGGPDFDDDMQRSSEVQTIPKIKKRRSDPDSEAMKQDRYRRLMEDAKEVAALASQKVSLFRYAKMNQGQAIRTLITMGAVQERQEIDCPRGTQKKGKPRKKGYSKPGGPAIRVCLLCDQRHHWKDCQYVEALHRHMNDYALRRKGKYECEFCRGPSKHDPRECPCVLRAREDVTDLVTDEVTDGERKSE
jgi:hypothetical protein